MLEVIESLLITVKLKLDPKVEEYVDLLKTFFQQHSISEEKFVADYLEVMRLGEELVAEYGPKYVCIHSLNIVCR